MKVGGRVWIVTGKNKVKATISKFASNDPKGVYCRISETCPWYYPNSTTPDSSMILYKEVEYYFYREWIKPRTSLYNTLLEKQT